MKNIISTIKTFKIDSYSFTYNVDQCTLSIADVGISARLNKEQIKQLLNVLNHLLADTECPSEN